MVKLLLAAYALSPQFGRVLSSITPTFEGHWARKLKPESVRVSHILEYPLKVSFSSGQPLSTPLPIRITLKINQPTVIPLSGITT